MNEEDPTAHRKWPQMGSASDNRSIKLGEQSFAADTPDLFSPTASGDQQQSPPYRMETAWDVNRRLQQPNANQFASAAAALRQQVDHLNDWERRRSSEEEEENKAQSSNRKDAQTHDAPRSGNGWWGS